MLDQANLNSLPQRFGKFESRQIALECFDMLTKVGGVAVGAGGVDAAKSAPTPERFNRAVVGRFQAGCGGAPEHARHDRAVVDLHVGVRQCIVDLTLGGHCQTRERACPSNAGPVLIGSRTGDVLAALESMVVVVDDLGTVEELFEGDVVEESCISSAGITLDHLCVQVAVLRCAGDGSAGPPDDVPCQCAS
ncbi:hypothetical protein, partial [Mycolicibacterium septicum]|uniref:hypothetical protein n=1 Tax=Mycolicibacterium septicum TaxID=98668 RepID=UPI0013A540F0